MSASPKCLTRSDVPAYLLQTWGLRCSHRTLTRMASDGGGPLFHRAGRDAYYEVSAIDDWAKRKLGPARETAQAHRGMQGCAA